VTSASEQIICSAPDKRSAGESRNFGPGNWTSVSEHKTQAGWVGIVPSVSQFGKDGYLGSIYLFSKEPN
jgi:hypothetical protein